MRLHDIIKMDKDFLTPADVAGVLNCTPQLIRYQAVNSPEKLGFHFCIIGNRIKIPKESFVRWMQEK